MQEFLEKARSFNQWHWQGSSWQYLLYAGILLVLLFSKRKIVRLILGWLPLAYLGCIYNPLFMAGLEMMGVGGNQYFARMFSFMPMMYAIAAGIVFLIGRIPKSWVKFISVVAVSVGLVLTGRSIYDQNWFVRAQNYAKVPNDTYQVAAVLKNTGDKNVSVATFDPITNYLRQVTDVVTAYARTPGDIWYKLNEDPTDVQAVMKAAGEQGMDFITARRTDMTIQAFHDAGYEPYALTDNLAIYEVKGVRKLVRTYNEKRQIASVTVYDAEGNIEKNSLGYSSIEFKYDERGYAIKETYIDSLGNKCKINNEYASIQRTYYQRSGLIESIAYLDERDQVIIKNGCYITKFEYDKDKLLRREDYYNEYGQAYASKKMDYNDRRQLIRESYYDSEQQQILSSSGYSSCAYDYDDEGRLIAARYYGTDGNLIKNIYGYAGILRTYDEEKRITIEVYLNENDQPFMLNDSHASTLWQVDSNGNEILWKYYDVEGKPVCRDAGYAEVRRLFDENNHLIEETYWDENGCMVNDNLGVAKIEYIYLNGLLVDKKQYDKDGNIV